MPPTEEQPMVDIQKGPGISAQLADAARNVCLATVIPPPGEGKPITFISHQANTRTATNEFLQRGDKTGIARILGIPTSDVQKRFRGAQPGICNRLPYTAKPGRTDYACTILALGDLSYEEGLPTLGSSEVKHSLKSGEALHFIGDLDQKYGEAGGGTLIWFYWSNLP